MSTVPRGLYEALLRDALSALPAGAQLEDLRSADAADRLALHLSRVLERAIDTLPERTRADQGADLTAHLLKTIADGVDDPGVLLERPVLPARVLRAVRDVLPDGNFESIDQPLIPLLDTTLLTNSPGEPRVGEQLRSEIASADRVDVIMAFVRRSGIVPILDALRRHVEAGRRLRILTTTYTGSTEQEALQLLADLGAEVKVSYDTSGTRLHAKAWLFHRASGYSTAYVGSSNLTHSAQVTGLEWNVRVSGARNRAVLEKISAVFDSYWEQSDFKEYVPERFSEELRRQRAPTPDSIISTIEVALWPFQERLLEEVELARQQGHHRNLLVAATGTGKTVMAAMDYKRLRERLPRARLLFVAHRQEILNQSRTTFAHVLGDAGFGELWVARDRPQDFDHVFASIQSLSANGLGSLDPTHFDVVIVDEFHHAAAASYDRLLKLVEPRELLGLTATPERGDGQSILHWFDGRIAAELRLWDAIDQGRLSPFAYYGIADDLDLRDIPWRSGTGYDSTALTQVITGTDVWARGVLRQVDRLLGNPGRMRALGFCVSVAHAEYMARVFTNAGVSATAISGESSDEERREALRALKAGTVNAVFSVDLFNEGVDLPAVDTLLMLRPTESPLLFLQQLGRGLRKHQGKSLCTVLDFVGHHRKEFRYDRRFQALLGGSRKRVTSEIERGFPFLPAGCHMELDRVARERVLENIKRGTPSRWSDKVAELAALAAENHRLSLGDFLRESDLDLEDVYSGDRRSWSDMCDAAGIAGMGDDGPNEAVLRRACGRLLHVDDQERLDTWRTVLGRTSASGLAKLSLRERRLVGMLLSQVLDQVADGAMTTADGLKVLRAHPRVCQELAGLFDVLGERLTHIATPLEMLSDVPLRVHARYTRSEILAACGKAERVKAEPWREGVKFVKDLGADVFVFTLDKTSGQFSPTTRYRDYAISRDLIHWESQSMTTATSPTGLRYQRHEQMGTQVLLFARLSAEDRAFHFLGPARYVSHEREAPMAITWRLKHQLPGDLFASFAAAVA